MADQKTTTVATREEGGLERFRELRDLMSVFPPEKFIRLLPSTFQEPSTLFRQVPAAIKVNPEDERDVYPMPGSRVRKLEDVGPDGKVCLTTSALERIGGLLGIRWYPTTFERDPTSPYMVTAHARAEWTDAVGERVPLSAAATCDYRDGSIGAKLLGGGLDTARQFVAERSEARARNRIVRKVTGMPSSFTKRELTEKAFVAVRWALDERQLDVRKALIERGTRSAQEGFGLSAGAPVGLRTEAAADEFSGEPIDARGSSSEMAATPSREERPGTPGEAAGSSPASRSAQVDPEPVEDEPAKPAVDVERAALIRAHVEKLRQDLRWGKEAREKRPTAPQAGASVSAIAAAIAEPKQLTNDQKKAVWRAVMEFLWGEFGSFEELSSDRVSTVIDWAKGDPAEVRELVLYLAAGNERVAEIHAALQGQGTLLEASR